ARPALGNGGDRPSAQAIGAEQPNLEPVAIVHCETTRPRANLRQSDLPSAVRSRSSPRPAAPCERALEAKACSQLYDSSTPLNRVRIGSRRQSCAKQRLAEAGFGRCAT